VDQPEEQQLKLPFTSMQPWVGAGQQMTWPMLSVYPFSPGPQQAPAAAVKKQASSAAQQSPMQAEVPAGQAQTLSAQVWLAAQACPQLPQLALSLLVSTALPQLPQFASLVELVQLPPQQRSVPEQSLVQTFAKQVSQAPHVSATQTSVEESHVWHEGHPGRHWPWKQVLQPPHPAWHWPWSQTSHGPGQRDVSSAVQVVHLPFTHWLSTVPRSNADLGQTVPHWPQPVGPAMCPVVPFWRSEQKSSLSPSVSQRLRPGLHSQNPSMHA
jgi:hypothetical protein